MLLTLPNGVWVFAPPNGLLVRYVAWDACQRDGGFTIQITAGLVTAFAVKMQRCCKTSLLLQLALILLHMISLIRMLLLLPLHLLLTVLGRDPLLPTFLLRSSVAIGRLLAGINGSGVLPCLSMSTGPRYILSNIF